MKVYSFFLGSKLICDTHESIYCYGNNPSVLAFRRAFIFWWYQHKGYKIIQTDLTTQGYDEPSLFSQPVQPSCYFLDKPPKNLKEIAGLKVYWQASHTKSALHVQALKENTIAALACYDLKSEEMVQVLTFYLFHTFNIKPQEEILKDLKELAGYLCQEPLFFFSEAYKLALSGRVILPSLSINDEDVIGPLRLESAILLKNLSFSVPSQTWTKLANLRHQEIIVKSGSAVTKNLLNYYTYMKKNL